MSDIKQAIQELREAGLFTPPPYQSDGPHTGLYIGGHHHTYWTIHNGDTGVAIIIMPDEEKTKAVIAEREATTRFVVESCNSALASSVEGGTVDITSRIEAAAEEIAKEIKLAWGMECDERDKSDIAAILKRHLEGGK